eukprot:TRINITY_DN12103_c0_g1_i1.p1 TRINITY_DN12103_c0_g1~~TRINITY_DN12103_c0_g1_i1.p1  ORF type:complete len:570 (+),score=175.98 TRINITY_DN12103_c0_g1_i1:37-1746(+)
MSRMSSAGGDVASVSAGMGAEGYTLEEEAEESEGLAEEVIQAQHVMGGGDKHQPPTPIYTDPGGSFDDRSPGLGMGMPPQTGMDMGMGMGTDALLAEMDDYDFYSHVRFGTDQAPAHDTDLLTESTDVDIRNLSVGERLYYIGCGMERNRQERLRRERESKIISELSQVTSKPMITSRARQLPSKGPSFAEQSVLWSKRLDKERRKHAAKKRMDDVAETLQRVEMNPRSAAMVERGQLKAKYKGPISGWNKHFARYQTKKNTMPEREVFSPNINISSSNLQRDGGVGERLFDEASRKEDRLRDMVNMASMKELIDPVTGKAYFKPAMAAGPVRSSSKQPSRDMDTVVNTLLSKGQEAQKKKEKLAVEAHTSKHSFQPKLNNRSKEMIGAKGRKPLYNTPATPSRFSKRNQSQERGKETPQYSTCTPAFMRRNERLVLHRQERVNEIKREQERRELEQCTFTPQICRQSEDILTHGQVLSTGAAYRSRSHEPVVEHSAIGYTPKSPHARPHAPEGRELKTIPPGAPWPVEINPVANPAPPTVNPDADPTVSNFEREMMSVLEEWRKLEDV